MWCEIGLTKKCLLLSSRSSLKTVTSEPSLVEDGLLKALGAASRAPHAQEQPTVVIIGHSGSTLSDRFSSLPFPQVWSPHWLMISNRSLDRDLEPYRLMSRRCGSIIESFEFDTEPHSQLASRLESLFSKTLEPFEATICLGRIQSDVSVAPNPRWNGWERIAHSKGLPLTFPKIFSVTGFLPSRSVIAPPSIARYTLSVPRTKAPAASDSATSQSSENALFLFSRGLEATERAAVVELDEGWYGLILLSVQNALPPTAAAASNQYPYTPRDGATMDLLSSEDAERHLILHILGRNSQLPFIGPLASLVVESNHPQNTIIPRVLVEHTAMDISAGQILVTALPLLPPSALPEYQPSYNPSPAQLEEAVLSGDDESLIIELARLQSFSQDLPNQRVNLFKQTERLRIIAESYAMPGLIESVASELRKDVAKSRATTLTSIIVLRLVEDIYAGNFPLEWTEQDEIEVTRAREKKRSVRNRKSAWDE